MSNKIAKNSICLCGSGKMYKECCGKGAGIYPTLSEFIGEDKENPTEFEKNIHDKFGHYPDDYIEPIQDIEYYNDVIYVLIDESNIGDNYAISGIVITKSEIEQKIDVQAKLYKLVENYNIDYIHFTEIFGRDNILGNKKKDFIIEYTDLVSQINFVPFAVCMSKSEIEQWINESNISSDQCYQALTWKLMFNIIVYCTWKYGINLIFEMWREVDSLTASKRILHQINSSGLIKDFPFAHISIYRHYQNFMKIMVLYSSISDFVAYLTCKIFPKIKSGVPERKIIKNNHDLLVMFAKIFDDSTYMRNKEFTNIIEIVRQSK